MTLKDYFQNRLGTQRQMAADIGRTQGRVSQMAATGEIPAELVWPIVRASGGHCTPQDLRPDLYPDDSALA